MAILTTLQQSSHESIKFIVRCLHPDLVSSLNNNNNNSNNNDSIVLDGDVKSPISTILSTPISGIVLECGGPNLREFLEKHSHGDIDAIHRVHILRDVVDAVHFLHDHKVVHGDLKPENIVSFSFLSEGMMRWKLVDFDTSFFEGRNNNNSNNSNLMSKLRLTPEYSSPELIQSVNSNSNQNSTTNLCLLSWRSDIWSLGLVSVFVLKGCSLWKLLHPQRRDFEVRMVEEFDESVLRRLMARELGEKERSFVEDCLRVDPVSRWSCQTLKTKTLFRTDTSTISANRLNMTRDTMNDHFSELKNTLQRFQEDGQGFVRGELKMKVEELILALER